MAAKMQLNSIVNMCGRWGAVGWAAKVRVNIIPALLHPAVCGWRSRKASLNSSEHSVWSRWIAGGALQMQRRSFSLALSVLLEPGQVVKMPSWPPVWDTGKGASNPWVDCAGPIGPVYIPVLVLTKISCVFLDLLACVIL